MRILLVNPPDGLYERTYLAPPLGLLTLASALRDGGSEVRILDLNLEVMSDPAIGDTNLFDAALEMINQSKSDVVGFTSMCLESHVALELARRVKVNSPDVTSIFGGTHFGAIAIEILENFPFVDYVVTGEGESGMVAIIAQLSGHKVSLPRNVWYREGKLINGTADEERPALDEALFPAYDLVDLDRYFSLNPDRLINYEAGRGCVFKCSFCYSPFQYGDAVRNKSVDVVIQDLRRLSHLGARHIFFVQDNLLNSPRWASELCDKIAEANLPLTWECYVTYPQLKEALVDSLARAGCRGIFTGIDAVTPESQVRMNKPFLRNWEATARTLSYCRKKGVLPICAFILEGPSEDAAKIDRTIRTAIECLKLGCEIHINTLSLYNQTALASNMNARKWAYSQIKPELLLDTPAVVQCNPFAKRLPHLFPYHSTEFDPDRWEIFTAKTFVLIAVMLGLRKTAHTFVAVDGHSLWEALDWVDSEFVTLIRRTPFPRRRFEAIVTFARHLINRNLATQSEVLLRQELAQVVLASHEANRVVMLRVGESSSEFVLGSFLWFSGGAEFDFNRGVVADLMLNSYLKLGDSSGSNQPASIDDYLLALRSQQDKVKIYALDQEKLRLLCMLLQASRDVTPFALSEECLKQLSDEGWIWRVSPPESGAFEQLSASGVAESLSDK